MDGKEQLFFVVESKGVLGYEYLRDSEKDKIDCGKAHHKELSEQTGNNITLEVVSNMDDFEI